MNLTEAYNKIWTGKLVGIQPPDKQHIDRVTYTASLFPALKDALLVDLGTGSGQMLAEAKRRGWKAMGYEFDLSVCQWLEREGYTVLQADLSTATLLPLPADIVTCCDVIEHLLDPLHAMREAHKILKPGGVCYVATPNLSAWRRVKTMQEGRHPRTSGDDCLNDGGHIAYFGPLDLTDLLKSAGFSKVEIKYFCPDRNPQYKHEWNQFTYMIAAATR